MLLRLVTNELIKIFGKWRSYIGFAALAILMPLVIWGMSKGSSGIEQSMTHQLQNSFIITGNVFNGFLATYFTMNFLWIHIPFLVVLVAGDVVAAEGASGTFRLYLTRPVSRFRVLTSKVTATGIYTVMLVLFFALMSLGLGSLWLGTGDLIVRHNGILILPPEMAWPRFGLSFLFATGTMLVVAALSFMFSSMVNNGIGPIIGAMAVIIVGLMISNIPIELFEQIQPYLFTSYFDIWSKAFHDPIPWKEIGGNAVVLAVYAAAFLGVSYTIFLRKDILS
ncbi:MAG: ABC transporter permease subunit [Candidatus Marinimicrobia bacterium]|nr:ABC transporter permease subunit [Candidatus Neomarinimicrobiota bacterium]MCF7828322.1 ABC transporter permease subunit [Candidatus Neomarinimicrobiota bacterium]MCF7879503.1 ABC transporter permease subunit [Candidatus Neomarinimicrobiota bacterium]